MEKVCEAEPFASNAFMSLANGYLTITKDYAMAMDAALRGLVIVIIASPGAVRRRALGAWCSTPAP